MTLIYICMIALAGVVRAQHGPYWDYSDGPTGPDYWKSNGFPDCANNQQSPINLPSPDGDVSVDKSLIPPDLEEYKNPVKVVVKNTGHTVSIRVLDDATKQVYARNSEGNRYRLLQFHFHWGKSDDFGSEHHIADKTYPLEIHFVHRSLRTSDELSTEKDNTAGELPLKFMVVGFFGVVTEDDNPAFDTILNLLEKIKRPNTQTNYTSDHGSDSNEIIMKTFLPDDTSGFYRYHGSFTTPPCTETVDWNVLTDTVGISKRQLKKLRTGIYKEPYTEEGESEEQIENSYETLTFNYRPIQPINGRKITYRPSTYSDTSGEDTKTTPTTMTTTSTGTKSGRILKQGIILTLIEVILIFLRF